MAAKKHIIKMKKPEAVVLDVSGSIARQAFMAYSPESKEFIRQYIENYVDDQLLKVRLQYLNLVRLV